MNIPEALPGEALREIRRAAADAELHAESLLQVPLIKKAFTNLDFQLVERGIDAFWRYQKHVPLTLTGFNPLRGAYYYGRNSFFSRWLRQPFASARELNESDFLVNEVLFMVHDYLHAWTFRMIDQLHPEYEVFTGRIDEESLDRHSFYHLLSEAVATVGLDYWFLSVTEVNDFCDLGSTRGPLTVSYRESHLAEYRRFCPRFEVQTPEFLARIASFYCTGKFPGFDAGDLRRSPRLLAWLKHELKYGVTQRELTRAWLSYLSPNVWPMNEKERSAPLAMQPEFRQLAEEMSTALWDLVKNDHDPCTSWQRGQDAGRSSSRERKPDFRFLNLNRWDPAEWRSLDFEGDPENFRYLLFQYLSAVPLSAMPRDRLKLIDLLKKECNPHLVQLVFQDLPRLEPGLDEPRDLFLAN